MTLKRIMMLAAVGAAVSLSSLPALAHCGSPSQTGGVHLPFRAPLSRLTLPGKTPVKATIIGLWDSVYTTSDGQPFQESFDTWHSDGSELEQANVPFADGGNICVGMWEQTGPRAYREYHTAWTYDQNDNVNGTIQITANLKVARDNSSYSGNWDFKLLDLNGNIIQEVTGTEVATRMTFD